MGPWYALIPMGREIFRCSVLRIQEDTVAADETQRNTPYTLPAPNYGVLHFSEAFGWL